MKRLIGAIARYLRAEDACNKARDEYGGYSWDYAGHDFIKDVENAQDEFEQALNAIIDERIRIGCSEG